MAVGTVAGGTVVHPSDLRSSIPFFTRSSSPSTNLCVCVDGAQLLCCREAGRAAAAAVVVVCLTGRTRTDSAAAASLPPISQVSRVSTNAAGVWMRKEEIGNL